MWNVLARAKYDLLLWTPLMLGLSSSANVLEVCAARGGQQSHISEKVAYCSPPLLTQSRRHGGLTLIHDIFFFQVVDTCIYSCFKLGFHLFRFHIVSWMNIATIFSDPDHFLPSLISEHPAAENRNNRGFYNDVNTGWKLGLITGSPSSSSSVT